MGANVGLGAFAHEIQKERGMTGGFLGSKGEKFRNELPGQRKDADQRLAALQEALRGLDRSGYPAEVIQALDKAMNAVKELPGVRGGVDRLDIAGPKAIGYYTDTIELLLGVGRQAKTLASDEKLARLSVTYLNFSFAKERVGVERGADQCVRRRQVQPGAAGAFPQERLGPGHLHARVRGDRRTAPVRVV